MSGAGAAAAGGGDAAAYSRKIAELAIQTFQKIYLNLFSPSCIMKHSDREHGGAAATPGAEASAYRIDCVKSLETPIRQI